MPILESKRTGRIENVSMETYEQMKYTGHIRNFKVISTEDIEPKKTPKTPEEVKDFMTNPVQIIPKKIYGYEELEEMTVAQLKEIATERDIEFANNILKKDLIEKILND